MMLVGVSGGFANKAAHDKFCSNLDCVISFVIDQSPQGNHFGQRHKLVNASKHPITVGSNVPVYGQFGVRRPDSVLMLAPFNLTFWRLCLCVCVCVSVRAR